MPDQTLNPYKLLRLRHHLTQSEWAARLNLTTTYVSRLENGHATPSKTLVILYAMIRDHGLLPGEK